MRLSAAVAVAVVALAIAAVSLSGGSNAPRALAASPPNDDFANATVIEALPFATSQDVTDATAEPNEPQSSCLQTNRTIWFKYVAPSHEVIVVDATGTDSSLSVSTFTDSQFGLTEVNCVSLDRRMSFAVEAGRAFYIRLAFFGSDSLTSLQLSIAPAESPPNDDFADAIAVGASPFEDTVDMFTATSESVEPQASCGFEGAQKTVWYRIVIQKAMHVSASVRGANSAYSGAILTIYQGSSLSSLEELDCAQGDYSGASSFTAEAGKTYYLQATFIQSHSPFGESAPTDVIDVRVETFDVPTCAPGESLFADPASDLVTFGLPTEGAVDVTSVAGGHDGTNYCLRIGLAQPLPSSPEETRIKVGFDVDSDWRTGEGYVGFDWPCYMGIGWELEAFFDAPRQVLDPLSQFVPRTVPPPIGTPPVGPTPLPPPIGLPTPRPNLPEPIYASVLYEDSSVQLIVPLSALGDDRFRVAIAISHEGRIDCIPNAGAIVSPTPAPPGDANCDTAIDALDSALLLQRFAGLLRGMLPCESVADVNQNGSIGPIDAVLILQYTAGMIDEFRPET